MNNSFFGSFHAKLVTVFESKLNNSRGEQKSEKMLGRRYQGGKHLKIAVYFYSLMIKYSYLMAFRAI